MKSILANDNQKRISYLKDLVSSYLYKDILELDGLKHSDKIVKILQLLAFQIGSEVSYSEIGSQIGLNKKTIEKYLDCLEKVFVIFKLRGFSRNPRKEISKSPKYYFWRTYTQKEVDFVEEREGKLFGYEFKWDGKKAIKEPKEWRGTCSNAEYQVITPENYLDFIL